MANTIIMKPGSSESASTAQASMARGASGIGFENVSVAYGNQTIVDSLNLTVKPGEIVALIGPSGSGKTTALRAVAGFVQPSAGRIVIGDRDVTRLPPYARNIGMVVQNYALFPHMRVEDNVAFGLRARHASADVIRERVPECLGLVGMAKYAKRYPRELSGGQQQRVAIARALAIRPQVLLLDEPLSALDAQIRRSMVDEIGRLHRTLPSLTVLYVTHDQTEALTLANHIGIMRDGKLIAFGETQGLYRHPPNRFSAEFLGRANVLPAEQLEPLADGFARVRCADVVVEGRNHHNLATGSACFVCVRPHDMHFEAAAVAGRTNHVTGVVRSVQWLGEMLSIVLEVGDTEIRLSQPPLARAPEPGSALTVYFDAANVTFVPEVEGHG